MTIDNFISDLMKHFNYDYTEIAIRDIKRYLTSKNLSENKIVSMYDFIIRKNTFLPKLEKIIESENNTFDRQPGELHEQSPQQQLVKNAERSPAEIVENCKLIRFKINNGHDVTGANMSFLILWEDLGRVPEEMRDTAKQFIVEGKKRELEMLIESSTEKVKFDDIKIERNGRPVSIGKVLKENCI